MDSAGPSWGIWIDGKNASEGEQAYGAAYSKLMRRALLEVYRMQQKHVSTEVAAMRVQHLLHMPFLDKFGGLFDTKKAPGRNFRRAFECIQREVPQQFVTSMLQTDIDDVYDVTCLPSKPCRSPLLPLRHTLEQVFKSYHSKMAKAKLEDEKLRLLASLLKNLALLHPLPDRNGRSRLLLLQFELRRLGLACGTMLFNNNNNIYVDSVSVLAAKIKEGIAMYNRAVSTGVNPWLGSQRQTFPSSPYAKELSRCYEGHSANRGHGLSIE